MIACALCSTWHCSQASLQQEAKRLLSELDYLVHTHYPHIIRTVVVLLLFAALTLLLLRDEFALPPGLLSHDLEHGNTQQDAASSVVALQNLEAPSLKRGGDYETDQMEGFSLVCLMEGETLPPEYAPSPRVAHKGATVGDVGAFGWGRIADAFEPSDVAHSVRAAFTHMGAPSILDRSWDMVTWSQLYPVPTRENPKWEIYGVSTFKDVPLTASKLGTFAKARLFRPSSEDEAEAGQASAIIGSPNGRGVAWLLAQHKDLFGATRQISKIRVWDGSEGKANAVVSEGLPNIMFELGGSTTPPSKKKKRDTSLHLESRAQRRNESSSNVDTDDPDPRPKKRNRNGVDLLLKRTPGQHDYYDKDVARGCELNRLMRSSTEDPKYPATGSSYHEITDAGWVMVNSEGINRNHRYRQDVMEKLKIPPTTDPSWTFIYWKYEKFSKDHINPKSGKGYRTGGYYSNAYNCAANIILAISNNSPRNAQENPSLTKSDIPPIEKWSDINALTWKEICPPNTPLHYILRLHVNNNESRNILRLTLGLTPPTQNKNLGTYPGKSFDPSSPEGLALLGSPNGRGGAFMVSQHKALFGATRQVTKISVWGNTQDPDFLFEFGAREGHVPSASVDLDAPYEYSGEEGYAGVPCFVFPCGEEERRR
ncbi:uncharacterized protein MYCFIDRAFT_75143 [Pseudocercospora fijiensis CIRAD86]|uniref:Uncharacterized protein n=1 Tax=Pseudocercospora fijiensis (strain CIRAD86) TaxID=383855 RepID=N1Q8R8_PSEFD|nr:uncharacterized protein MYCFIDRAFT_75143 [Pseudocercospora fijiensis CIRAD86]EME87278.1 hypothetical protein MYCFIDRAFT_75143 [Pseudocercospora fijiensis CIRAD86]